MKTLHDYPDILNMDEACEILRIGHNNMYKLLNSGELKAFKNGRVWKIPKLSVEQFIKDKMK